VTVAAAPAFALATLRVGAVQIPAIGAAGAYWPLAAAAPAGFAGLDRDIKGVLVNWPVAFQALQDYAAACTGGGVPQSAAIAASQADIALPIQYPNKLVAIGATPAAFIRDPHNLRITLSVNGAMKQNASTAGMIYRIDEQLSSISQFVTLEPGDVVLTGSPAGVGLPRGEFLKPGDKVIATAEGVGELHMEIA
jgi:hypothetical protein